MFSCPLLILVYNNNYVNQALGKGPIRADITIELQSTMVAKSTSKYIAR